MSNPGEFQRARSSVLITRGASASSCPTASPNGKWRSSQPSVDATRASWMDASNLRPSASVILTIHPDMARSAHTSVSTSWHCSRTSPTPSAQVDPRAARDERPALCTESSRRALTTAVRINAPPGDRGRRAITIDEGTVTALRTHRRAMNQQRLLVGADFNDRDLVFRLPSGEPLHPDAVSATFERQVRRYGLPRLTLHGPRSARTGDSGLIPGSSRRRDRRPRSVHAGVAQSVVSRVQVSSGRLCGSRPLFSFREEVGKSFGGALHRDRRGVLRHFPRKVAGHPDGGGTRIVPTLHVQDRVVADHPHAVHRPRQRAGFQRPDEDPTVGLTDADLIGDSDGMEQPVEATRDEVSRAGCPPCRW